MDVLPYGIVWLPVPGETQPICPAQDYVVRSCQRCCIALYERCHVICGDSYCVSCYAVIEEEALRQRDFLKSMPHRVSLLEKQIERHRHFAKLEPITKMHFAECVLREEAGVKQRVEDRKFLRYLWKYLHY